MKKILPILLCLNTFALVDYTEPSSYSPAAPVQRKAARITKKTKAPRRQSSQKFLELMATFKSQSFKSNSGEAKVSTINVDGHIQTNYDLYLDFSLPMHSGKLSEDQVGSSYQKGNPKVILGLNWLQFGSAERALTLDIYGGGIFSSSSDFATQRTDKIVGISTSKRFYNFGFGLAYELNLTGTSKDQLEQDIGNIQQLKAQIGWLVSNDIRFILNANNVKISESTDAGRSSRLDQAVKYAYIKPEVVLTLSPGVDFHMMALFLTRRPKQGLVSTDAKLWSLDGFYGNSLSAGLNISI